MHTQATRTNGKNDFKPKVLLVGGEDVQTRLELMQGLSQDFEIAAAGTDSKLASIFARHGFNYFYYPLRRGISLGGDGFAFAGLLRMMASIRPDIVHAFDTKPGVYGCLAARCAGVPIVIGTITGLGSLYSSASCRSTMVRKLYERLQRLTCKTSDLTIFQNSQDCHEFVSRRVVPEQKAVVVPGSGVRTAVFDPARFDSRARQLLRDELGIPPTGLVVTMIARVVRSKGVEDFVTAAKAIRERDSHAHFLLVGAADRESIDRFSVEDLAQISSAVIWPGGRRDIPDILAASDLFVLPSYLREGIPRSLLEAAAMALPLITTDTPGCNDVVEHGVNGLLTPPRDQEALNRAILDLLGSAELRRRFGRESRKRALELFDISIVVAQTRQHYQELLARKKCSPKTKLQNARILTAS